MKDISFPLPCIVCDKIMVNAIDDSNYNQPNGGLTFTAYGSYGSSFDPMNDSYSLVVNICDECLHRKGLEHKVVLNKRARPVPTPSTNQYWDNERLDENF